MTGYDPVAAQAQYKRFKTRLTRALNVAHDAKTSDAWRKVIVECDAFDAYYAASTEPTPDNWHRWQRARDDANDAIRRNGYAN